jgi:hypothetical protein
MVVWTMYGDRLPRGSGPGHIGLGGYLAFSRTVITRKRLVAE